MSGKEDHSGINSLVHGNESDARELRANLARFARQTDTPQVRKMVAEVLAGRRNVREVFRTKEFNEAVGVRLGNVEAGLAQLTDEQRAEVWSQDRPDTPAETLEALMSPYDPPAELEDAEPPRQSQSWDEDDFSQNSIMR